MNELVWAVRVSWLLVLEGSSLLLLPMLVNTGAVRSNAEMSKFSECRHLFCHDPAAGLLAV